jgi:hypothetical protein
VAAERRPAAVASGPRCPLFRDIDAEVAAGELVVVELLDRPLRLLGGLEFDERETAGACGLAITRQEDVFDLPDLREQVLQLFFGGLEIEVANEDLGSQGASPF